MTTEDQKQDLALIPVEVLESIAKVPSCDWERAYWCMAPCPGNEPYPVPAPIEAALQDPDGLVTAEVRVRDRLGMPYCLRVSVRLRIGDPWATLLRQIDLWQRAVIDELHRRRAAGE